MRDTTELFDLVKSLSRSEKRYISVAALAHKGDSFNYKMFRVLDSMAIYDPERFRHLLKKESVSDNTAVIKLGLHKFIMKTLRNYHSGGNETITMYERLIDLQIMYDKKNTEATRKLISQLEKVALKQQALKILSICHTYERALNNRLPLSGAEVQSCNKRYLENLEQIKTETIYLNLGELIHSFYKEKGIIRSRNEMERIRKYLKDPYLQNKKLAISFQSVVAYHRIRAFCYVMLGEHNKALTDVSAEINLMRAIIPDSRIQFPAYVSICGNRIEIYMELKKYNDALREINELKRIPAIAAEEKWAYKIPQDMVNRLQVDSLLYEGALYIHIANFEKALGIFAGLEALVKKLDFRLDASQVEPIPYFRAYLHFIHGDLKNALTSLKAIIKPGKEKGIFRQDIYSYAKLLQLIVHYELKDEELSAYLLRSAYRYLKQMGRDYPLDKALLLFMKDRLAGKNAPYKFRESLLKLKLDLERIIRKDGEASVLKYFDYVSWIESKLTRKPFMQIMKEKYYVTI
jgi:hypothetical protein